MVRRIVLLRDALDDDAMLSELAEATRSLAEQPNNVFGHCDVRSDNLTYNRHTGQVKLVDWNWASYTPVGFGPTEFLVEAAQQGVDVTPWLNYLNPQLLAAMIGIYGRKCIETPPPHLDSKLRDFQAGLAAMAYWLYSEMQS